MSLGIYCYSYIYNVKVEQYCWNQPYNCLLMCSHWSVLNIRCCSHSFSPFISYRTVREKKCLLRVCDAQPLFTVSAASCSLVGSLKSHAHPHWCSCCLRAIRDIWVGGVAAAQNWGQCHTASRFVLTFKVFFFFPLTSSKRTIATNPKTVSLVRYL